MSVVFFTQSLFAVPKDFRLSSTHYFFIKIPNKRKLHQITFNHSSDIDFKDFINLYKKCTAIPYSSSVIDTAFEPDNLLRFVNNIKTKHGNWG